MSNRPVYARPHLRSCGEIDPRKYSKPISDARLRKAAMEHFSTSRRDENHKKHHKETEKVPIMNEKRQIWRYPTGLLISGSGVRVPARVPDLPCRAAHTGGSVVYWEPWQQTNDEFVRIVIDWTLLMPAARDLTEQGSALGIGSQQCATSTRRQRHPQRVVAYHVEGL